MANTMQVADFSTQSLTDAYADNVCGTQGSAPPLGALSRLSGQYAGPASLTH